MLADSVFEAKVEGQVDYVRAYFGMRKVSLGHVGGEKSMRVLLNDKFVFLIGMLDQVCLILLIVQYLTLSKFISGVASLTFPPVYHSLLLALHSALGFCQWTIGT